MGANVGDVVGKLVHSPQVTMQASATVGMPHPFTKFGTSAGHTTFSGIPLHSSAGVNVGNGVGVPDGDVVGLLLGTCIAEVEEEQKTRLV